MPLGMAMPGRYLLSFKGDGGGAPALNGATLSGPDVGTSGSGGVVLKAPSVVFVSGVGLPEGIRKSDQDVAWGDAVDGVRSDSDLGNDQAIGGGGSDGRTGDVASGFLAAGSGLAASGGIEGRRSSAGDIVEKEGGTAGGA